MYNMLYNIIILEAFIIFYYVMWSCDDMTMTAS